MSGIEPNNGLIINYENAHNGIGSHSEKFGPMLLSSTNGFIGVAQVTGPSSSHSHLSTHKRALG